MVKYDRPILSHKLSVFYWSLYRDTLWVITCHDTDFNKTHFDSEGENIIVVKKWKNYRVKGVDGTWRRKVKRLCSAWKIFCRRSWKQVEFKPGTHKVMTRVLHFWFENCISTTDRPWVCQSYLQSMGSVTSITCGASMYLPPDSASPSISETIFSNVGTFWATSSITSVMYEKTKGTNTNVIASLADDASVNVIICRLLAATNPMAWSASSLCKAWTSS